jgi:quinoprotein glucose dehydrogenase
LHGGAEWPGASADPFSGILYVSSTSIPWTISIANLAKLQDESDLSMTAGRQLYLDKCSVCHGANRDGVGATPPLLWVSSVFSKEQVRNFIRSGRRSMVAVEGLVDDELDILLEYLFERDKLAQDNWASKRDNKKYRYIYKYFLRLEDFEGYPATKPPWGQLSAIDLNSGRIKWQVPLGEYEELTRRGIPITGTENFSGPTVAAGGVIFASGTKDKKIRAFDTSTGAELWSYELPFVGSAPPSIYQIQGRQYVVIPATGSSAMETELGDVFIAFSLPAKSFAK